MATDDQQRLVTGTASAPASFTVPGNGQIRPKSVFAHYDGSGAATPFLPALKVISDAGKTVGIYPANSSIVAGGSADVSWFPDIGSGSVSLSSPGLMAARVNITGNQAVAQGDPGTFITWGEAVVDTGTPSPFWDAGNPTRLTAPVDGIYMDLVNLEWQQLQTANRPGYVAVYLYKNAAVSPHYFYDVNTAEPVESTNDVYNLTGVTHGIFPMQAGDYWRILAYNNNVGNQSRNLIDLRPVENHYSSFSMILVGTL